MSYVTASKEGTNEVPTWFGIHNDSVSLPSGGNEFAFLSFKSLHRLMNLKPENKNEFGARINSRVVSLSGRAVATDSSSDGAPLKIRLRRVERRMARDEKTVCVSWDRNAAAWSPKGCSLVDEVSA